MKRYRMLFLVTVGIGLVLALLGRMPRRAGETVATPAATALDIEDGAVTPAASTVAKGVRVRLRVTNRSGRLTELALAGYQDRVRISLARGATGQSEFLADRPGEDFAWLIDGKPAGRLSVSGSHLVEGHR